MLCKVSLIDADRVYPIVVFEVRHTFSSSVLEARDKPVKQTIRNISVLVEALRESRIAPWVRNFHWSKCAVYVFIAYSGLEIKQASLAFAF